MAKPRNSFEVMAVEAAKRIEAARAAGEQLTFLPDEAGAPPVDTIERKAGRPKGALSKGSNQMRDWLAAKGYRLPEEVLAEMAGLAGGDDALVAAMVAAERVLTWAYADSGGGKVPSPAERLAMFSQLLTVQLRAADALLPYGTPKASPDVSIQQNVQVVVPGAPADPAGSARDVTPRASGRMVPADVRHEMQQNQEVSQTDIGHSDGPNSDERGK